MRAVEPNSFSKIASRPPLVFDPCEFRDDGEVARVQKKFADYFQGACLPILDLGCGRGGMLQILLDAGIECYGVDSFGPAVEHCGARGLRAIHENVFEHLATLPDASVGGVFCSHLIEHLPSLEGLKLLEECHRVLCPGGRLVLITPNSRDLLVATEVFWLDLTHVRFYPARLLQRLIVKLGFTEYRIFEDADTRHTRIWWRRIVSLIRKAWFWGMTSRGDIVAVATK